MVIEDQRREPVLNVPAAVWLVVLALVAIHLITVLGSPGFRGWTIEQFAFIPARLSVADGGPQRVWMWLTYSLLHGDAAHLAMNSLWLAIFGAPVARRLGVRRYALLSVAGAIGAVALHLFAHWGQFAPVIGYSGVVSALTGAAARFAFGPGGLGGGAIELRPRLSLVQTLTNRSSLGFVAVWMIANLLVGSGMLTPDGPRIAWEAHVGGFMVGLLLFGAFDRQVPPIEVTNDSDEPSEFTDR